MPVAEQKEAVSTLKAGAIRPLFLAALAVAMCLWLQGQGEQYMWAGLAFGMATAFVAAPSSFLRIPKYVMHEFRRSWVTFYVLVIPIIAIAGLGHVFRLPGLELTWEGLTILAIIALLPFFGRISELRTRDFGISIDSREVSDTIDKAEDAIRSKQVNTDWSNSLIDLVRYDRRLGLARLQATLYSSLHGLYWWGKPDKAQVAYNNPLDIMEVLVGRKQITVQDQSALTSVIDITSRVVDGQYIKMLDALRVARIGTLYIRRLNEVYSREFETVDITPASDPLAEGNGQPSPAPTQVPANDRYRVTTVDLNSGQKLLRETDTKVLIDILDRRDKFNEVVEKVQRISSSGLPDTWQVEGKETGSVLMRLQQWRRRLQDWVPDVDWAELRLLAGLAMLAILALYVFLVENNNIPTLISKSNPIFSALAVGFFFALAILLMSPLSILKYLIGEWRGSLVRLYTIAVSVCFVVIAWLHLFASFPLDWQGLVVLLLLASVPFLDRITGIQIKDFEFKIALPRRGQARDLQKLELGEAYAEADWPTSIIALVRHDKRLGLARLLGTLYTSMSSLYALSQPGAYRTEFVDPESMPGKLFKLKRISKGQELQLVEFINRSSLTVHGDYIDIDEAVVLAQIGIDCVGTLNLIYSDALQQNSRCDLQDRPTKLQPAHLNPNETLGLYRVQTIARDLQTHFRHTIDLKGLIDLLDGRDEKDELVESVERVEDFRKHLVFVESDGMVKGYENAADARARVAAIFSEIKVTFDRLDPAEPRRLLLYAHGPLISENHMLAHMSQIIPRFTRQEGYIYPLVFIWHNGYWNILIDRLRDANQQATLRAGQSYSAAGAAFQGAPSIALDTIDCIENHWDDCLEAIYRVTNGKERWQQINDQALSSTIEQNGAARLVADSLPAIIGNDAELHILGHSTGCIFLAPLLQLLTEEGKVQDGPMRGATGLNCRVASCTLWAPACSLELFEQTYLPAIESHRIKQFTLFTLSDSAERDDDCGGIYKKSLLYLISNSLEKTHRTAEHPNGHPVVGMEKFVNSDRRIRSLIDRGRIDWISCPGGYGESSESRAMRHMDFDRDPITFSATRARILGQHSIAS